MSLRRTIVNGIKSLFHKGVENAALDEEILDYVDSSVKGKMRAGMSGESALRAAQMELGGVESLKEKVRSVGWETTVETFWQDVRFGLRMLLKNPGFTAIAVLTLALGIGANTAIFTVVNAVLLHPLPYKDSGQLVVMNSNNPQRNLIGLPISCPKLARIQQQAQSFQSIGAYFGTNASLATRGTPEQIQAARATRNFFDVLGISLAKGRGFLPEEDSKGGANVAIISDAFWQSHFGADPDVIGKAIPLDGLSVTIVGILPASFRFPFVSPEPEVWYPRVFENQTLPQSRIDSGASYLSVYGRLKSGESAARAQAEINVITAGYADDFPGFVDGQNNTTSFTPLMDSLVGGTVRVSLLVLFAAVGFVLLIGCANVACLLLARATVRHREIAVRRALGASTTRLLRQLLTESLLLSFIGGALGVLFAWLSLRLLSLLPLGALPRVEEVRLDSQVLGFTVLICFLTGIAFGLMPALRVARKDFHGTLKEGSRGSTEGKTGGRSRSLLVVAEVAAAVVLAAGAGLLIKSFSSLMRVNIGFEAKNVMTFSTNLPLTKYALPVQQSDFVKRLVEATQALPGVQSASSISYLPLEFPFRVVYVCPEGTVCQGVGKDQTIAIRHITPDYFQTMKIPLVEGRAFNDHDTANSAPVVIIDESAAKLYFPDQDPIGKRIMQSSGKLTMQVIGVVRDIKFIGLSVPQLAGMYVSQVQEPISSLTLVVRSNSAPGGLIRTVTAKISEMDPDLPLSNIQSMEAIVAGSVAQPRLTAQFTGLFAALALVLAAVGIYGVMAYSVTQRRHELGIRMALGAQPRDILTLVVGQGMRLVVAGAVAGIAASLALTRLMQTLLFGTSARDPFTLGGATSVLVIVALAACYVPARRAARVDPIIALRHE